MTRIRRICADLAILFALFVPSLVSSQNTYPEGYFISPVDFRILLSGTFGEIRSNHFHSGIDIKTNGAEGAKVYAVADGYVSRIKVSPYGFGKALYITHPNGYVSVYGHLRGYNQSIGEYVRRAQYNAESFEIELFPSKDELPVKQGDIVAYSGNSGGSGGPHLHFEMRDEATQYTINPLLFGYEVKDFYKPRITSIKIYPEDAGSKVNNSGKAVRYLVEGWGEEHRLVDAPVIKLSGNISFAIQVYDQQNDTDNKNGPYSITLFIDNIKMYEFAVETFPFDKTRYVNSLLDYEELKRNNVRLIRTCIDPGNRLEMYGDVKNQGVFAFNDTLTHTIRYEVKDVPGNVGVLEFKVKSAVASQQSAVKEQSSTFNYNTTNHFENISVILDAPKGVFYRNFEFKYDSAKKVPGTYSNVHRIHNKYTPVQDYITLAVKPSGLPEKLRPKALVVKIDDDGSGFSSAGGQYDEDGFVRTKIREFGNYSVAVDTVPPKIKPGNAEAHKNMAGQSTLKMTITDNLSGIASYRGTLNGKWILMDYDAKNDLLIYSVDERLVSGTNSFELKVTDEKGNVGSYKATLIR